VTGTARAVAGPGRQRHGDGLAIRTYQLLSCVGTSDDSSGDPEPLPWTTAWVVRAAGRCGSTSEQTVRRRPATSRHRRCVARRRRRDVLRALRDACMTTTTGRHDRLQRPAVRLPLAAARRSLSWPCSYPTSRASASTRRCSARLVPPYITRLCHCCCGRGACHTGLSFTQKTSALPPCRPLPFA